MQPIFTKHHTQAGFTLVEVAVVVPMIVVIVVGILALLIVLVTNNVAQNTRSNVVGATRAALSTIEKDVDASTLFLPDGLPSATYKDFNAPGLSGTYKTAFGTLPSGTSSNNLNTLFIQGFNQMIDPADASQTKVVAALKGTAPCIGFTVAQTSNAITIAEIYFVDHGTLYRRTLIDKTNPTACGTLQIKQSCPSGSDANTPACTVKDTTLLTNVTKFKIDYYDATGTLMPNVYTSTPPTIDTALSILVTITSTTNASGTNVDHTSSLRMTRISD